MMELDTSPGGTQKAPWRHYTSQERCSMPGQSARSLFHLENNCSDNHSVPSCDNCISSNCFSIPKSNKQVGAVISKIEDIFQRIVDCVAEEQEELVIHLKSRTRSGKETLDASNGAIKQSPDTEARAIRFPGKTIREAWKFTAITRILELSHEALVTGVVKTKRDIYYRDPELFVKQKVVDRYVDDIAFTLGVNREELNIVSAAKGLVAGYITIFRADGTIVDCHAEKEGVLIPSIEETDHISMQARWILVVEKEATFRSLLASGFYRTSHSGKGILITGKGYPDILTRAFTRHISNIRPSDENRIGSPYVKVLALMDYDPDGMGILSTYKHGSVSLAHENRNLVIPRIKWLGINSELVRNIHKEKIEALLRLTRYDRRKATLMLEKPVFQEEVESLWRRELQVMLMLNIKAEIQALGETSDLEKYLTNELSKDNGQRFWA